MNSFVLSMPRWFSTKLRTAASTSTARLRPAATGIVTLRIGHAKNFLERRIHLQAVEFGERLVAVVLEVNHQLQQLARAHRGFAENRADVEDADAAHLEKVAQHRGTAALERVGRDAVELDDVVGDEPVAARDELQREFALADRRRPGDRARPSRARRGTRHAASSTRRARATGTAGTPRPGAATAATDVKSATWLASHLAMR